MLPDFASVWKVILHTANLALEKTLMLGTDRASSPRSAAHWQGELTHLSPSIVTEQTEETRNPLSPLSQPDSAAPMTTSTGRALRAPSATQCLLVCAHSHFLLLVQRAASGQEPIKVLTKQSVSTGWVNSCLKRVGTARQSKHQENTALPSLTQGLFPPQEKLA